MKKFIAATALLFFGLSASAGALEEKCKSLPASKLEITYPAAVLSDVTSGKQTATVRKGIRCFKAGDVLDVADAKTKEVKGKVVVQEISLVTFATVTAKAATRSGDGNVAGLQKKLVEIYGEEIKTSELTEIFFSIVK